MKTVYIFGAGGFAREVEWMHRQIPPVGSGSFCGDVFFVTKDGSKNKVNGRSVICESEFLSRNSDCECYIGIGDPHIREKVVDFIRGYSGNYCFPTLIHKNVEFDKKTVSIGQGTIICDGAKFTVNAEIGCFNVINLNTTIGHDVKSDSYVTFSPGSNISGNVEIGRHCYFGTNCTVLENTKIINKTIVGACCTVVKDILESGTYIGTPAKRIK